MNDQEQRDAALAEFLANGGVIQTIPTGKSGRVEGAGYSAWGAPRKAGRPAATETPVPSEEVDDDL